MVLEGVYGSDFAAYLIVTVAGGIGSVGVGFFLLGESIAEVVAVFDLDLLVVKVGEGAVAIGIVMVAGFLSGGQLNL